MNTRTQSNTRSDAGHSQGGQVALVEPRILMPIEAKAEFAIDIPQWRVLVEAIFPAAKTPAAVLMALEYCRRRNLDIFKKPVHIVPMWSSQLGKMVETVWPGIAELRTTAFRTGEYAGAEAIEWGPVLERHFVDQQEKWVNRERVVEQVEATVRFHEWGRITVYRKIGGEVCRFVGPQVYWEETYASIGKTIVPNDRWQRAPRGQHEKTVEAAALRRAFPEELGGEYAAEEMEGKQLLEAVPYAVRDAGPAAPSEPELPPAATTKTIDQSSSEAKPAASGGTARTTAAAAGSAQGGVQPTGLLSETDQDRFLAELGTACQLAANDAELRAAWDRLKGAYVRCDPAHQKRANKIANDRRKALAAPPQEEQAVQEQQQDQPADEAGDSAKAAFLAELDRVFGTATDFQVLDTLYSDQINPRLADKSITPSDVEGEIQEIYQRHRDRIENADPFPGDA
jgi:phage recombination protein Bet